MARSEDLSDLRNFLYERAERLWQISLVLALLTLCFTVIGLWSRTTGWIASAGVVAGLLPVAVTWLRELATGSQVRADKCRRLILFSDGLGTDVSTAAVAEAKAWAAGKQLAEAPFVRPYYSSTKTPGPQRLADIVTESAFFTEHLAAKIQFWLWAVFSLTLVAAILALNLADLAAALGTRSYCLWQSPSPYSSLLLSPEMSHFSQKNMAIFAVMRGTRFNGVRTSETWRNPPMMKSGRWLKTTA